MVTVILTSGTAKKMPDEQTLASVMEMQSAVHWSLEQVELIFVPEFTNLKYDPVTEQYI